MDLKDDGLDACRGIFLGMFLGAILWVGIIMVIRSMV